MYVKRVVAAQTLVIELDVYYCLCLVTHYKNKSHCMRCSTDVLMQLLAVGLHNGCYYMVMCFDHASRCLSADKYVTGGGPKAAENARIILKLMQFIGAVSGGKTVTQVALNYLMCKGIHLDGALHHA